MTINKTIFENANILYENCTKFTEENGKDFSEPNLLDKICNVTFSQICRWKRATLSNSNK